MAGRNKEVVWRKAVDWAMIQPKRNLKAFCRGNVVDEVVFLGLVVCGTEDSGWNRAVVICTSVSGWHTEALLRESFCWRCELLNYTITKFRCDMKEEHWQYTTSRSQGEMYNVVYFYKIHLLIKFPSMLKRKCFYHWTLKDFDEHVCQLTGAFDHNPKNSINLYQKCPVSDKSGCMPASSRPNMN